MLDWGVLSFSMEQVLYNGNSDLVIYYYVNFATSPSGYIENMASITTL